MSTEVQEMPEQGEIVLATITKVMDHGAYVTLDEYDEIQGFLHISEIAPGWIRSVSRFVKDGEKKVLLVKKVNPKRGDIDLSLKQVSKDQKKQKLKEHAKNVLDHAKKLGKKDYSGAIGKKTPDFVIMYMPNVSIYMSAIEEIPDLVEQAARHRVMVCPPSLIYAALKTIMLTWQQQEVYENAEEIKTQALEMHTRLKKFYDEFFKKIGTDLSRAVKAYSSGVRSWESRVMPSIRKIEEMGYS